MKRTLSALFLLALACEAPRLRAETGHEAWLRHTPVEAAGRPAYLTLPAALVVVGDSPVLGAARDELLRGVRGLLGRTLRLEAQPPAESALVIGTLADLAAKGVVVKPPTPIAADGYWITPAKAGGQSHWVITGSNHRGVLYGAFAFLRRIALRQPLPPAGERSEPYAPVRWVNEWNNLDGSIERGYAGRSLFFEQDEVREDLSAAREYARLLGSLGINACAVNNVNANPKVLTDGFLPGLVRLAAALRPYGVRMALSVDFSSPQKLGALDTFDPLDPRVSAFWKARVDALYAAIPDLAGFVLKADSEGRLGPSAYGRTHADAANVIARALAPHGGLFFYRGFVYDHHMDWRNLKNDRARAAHDNFIGLDGQFDDNVILQIKHGPIDFQVREPASPLFGALEKTNQAIELQVTQEYFGQGRQHVFLAPMWKDVLEFDLHAKGPGTPVKAAVAGKVFGRKLGGFVGVSNVGQDVNWLGHHLSQANLYSYGRLAWDPNLSLARISDEWTRQTFDHDPLVVSTVTKLLLESWRNFENYTGNLGTQTLTAIAGNHYGPEVESSERNGWGQWHRADEQGIGMDRTVATGTGYIGQYRKPVADMYESLATCPDELVLFMHHLPYTHVLHSGKTVIQHFYDAHYEGARAAADYVKAWKALAGRIDEQRYHEVLTRLEYQAGHAQVWRDAINSWFRKTSGIADAKGRVGNYPGRHEAEALELAGYTPIDVKPWEGASGARGVACTAAPSCSASLTFGGAAGWYDVSVRYFDQIDGVSRFRLLLNEQELDAWVADDRFPTRKPDSHSSTRRLLEGLALRKGDRLTVVGTGDGNEQAALDYLEITKHVE